MTNHFFTGAISFGALVAINSISGAAAQEIEHLDVIGQRTDSIASIEANQGSFMSPVLSDALINLPGVNANGNGPLTAIAQYRGLYGDRVRVNIDGAPVVGAGPNAMDPPLSNAFAKPATHIILYRGIAPVIAGPETPGGAISISQDVSELFDDQRKWRANLASQWQDQGNARHLSGNLGYHSEDFFIQGFAADQQRDDIDDGRNQTIPNSFYERNAYGLSSGLRYDNHEWTGSYQRIDTDDTGTAALAMDISYIDSAAYRLNYQWHESDLGTLSLRLSGNSNQHGMNNHAFRPATMPMMARLNTVDSLARGYEATWTQKLAAGELRVGLDWHTASHNSVITNPIMDNLRIHNFNGVERRVQSAFSQWQRDFSDLDMTLGLRYTEVDTDAGEVSNSMAMMNENVATLVQEFNSADRRADFSFLDATLHLNGNITKDWRWHAGLGQKGRAPGYTELYVWLPLGISAGLADGRNYLANLELDHELSRQMDFGLTYTSQRLTVSPRIFYQRIDDFIVGTPSENMTANMVSTMMSGRPPLQWINADATLYGFDMLLNARLADDWQLEMNASLVNGDRDDIDEPLYRIAPASLMTRLIWQKQAWTTSLEWQLVADQTDVSAIQDEQESSGYGLLNGNISYQLNRHIEISAMLKNLLDKEYQAHLGGVNRIAGIEQPQGEKLYEPGRTIAVNLKLSY